MKLTQHNKISPMRCDVAISLCCALSHRGFSSSTHWFSMITGIDDLLKLKFLQVFFQLLTSIIQYWIQTVDLISKTQSQQNN